MINIPFLRWKLCRSIFQLNLRTLYQVSCKYVKMLKNRCITLARGVSETECRRIGFGRSDDQTECGGPWCSAERGVKARPGTPDAGHSSPFILGRRQDRRMCSIVPKPQRLTASVLLREMHWPPLPTSLLKHYTASLFLHRLKSLNCLFRLLLHEVNIILYLYHKHFSCDYDIVFLFRYRVWPLKYLV